MPTVTFHELDDHGQDRACGYLRLDNGRLTGKFSDPTLGQSVARAVIHRPGQQPLTARSDPAAWLANLHRHFSSPYLRASRPVEGQGQRPARTYAEPEGDSGTGPALNLYCGGKGSKRPGPCPKGRHNAHHTMRAHADAAKHRQQEAAKRLEKAALSHAGHNPGTRGHAAAQARLEAAQQAHQDAREQAGRLEQKAKTLEHQAGVRERMRQQNQRPRTPAQLEAARRHMIEMNRKRKGTGQPEQPPAPPAESKPWEDGSKPDLGRVYNAATASLHVDPERFQFKLNTDKSGVTDEFKGVDTFNPTFAGTVHVWQDPADKKTYVVNGHHRHELASRTGHPDMAVRYIDAPDAKAARAIGALVNIAEGRGTAVDAAKFMRDTGTDPQGLAAHGVSLKGKVAADAVALSHLNDQAFNRVARGSLDPVKALAVAKHLPDHQLQDQLFRILDKRENEGKDLSPRAIEEMAREMAQTPTVKADNKDTLFPTDEEESLFAVRGELKAHVRAELSREVNDWLAVANKRRAGKVAGAGNVLDTEANKKIAESAEQVKRAFDTLVNRRGLISDAINQAAQQLHAAKNKKERDDAKRNAINAVRGAVFQEAGVGQPDARGAAAGAGGSGPPAEAGTPAEPAPAADAGGGSPVPAGVSAPEPTGEPTATQGGKAAMDAKEPWQMTHEERMKELGLRSVPHLGIGGTHLVADPEAEEKVYDRTPLKSLKKAQAHELARNLLQSIGAQGPGGVEESDIANEHGGGKALSVIDWLRRNGYVERPSAERDDYGKARITPKGEKLLDEFPGIRHVQELNHHREQVKEALASGKPVPEQVKAGYPDLVKEATAPEPAPSPLPKSEAVAAALGGQEQSDKPKPAKKAAKGTTTVNGYEIREGPHPNSRKSQKAYHAYYPEGTPLNWVGETRQEAESHLAQRPAPTEPTGEDYTGRFRLAFPRYKRELEAIPVGQEGHIDGFPVHRTGADQFKLERDAHDRTGQVLKVLNGEQAATYLHQQHENHIRPESNRIKGALARHETAGPAAFMTPAYDQEQEAFGKLPAGTRVAVTEGRFKGRPGTIVKDEGGSNRVQLDGGTAAVPITASAVEPLDRKLSWRDPEAVAERQKAQEGGKQVKLFAEPRPVTRLDRARAEHGRLLQERERLLAILYAEPGPALRFYCGGKGGKPGPCPQGKRVHHAARIRANAAHHRLMHARHRYQQALGAWHRQGRKEEGKAKVAALASARRQAENEYKMHHARASQAEARAQRAGNKHAPLAQAQASDFQPPASATPKPKTQKQLEAARRHMIELNRRRKGTGKPEDAAASPAPPAPPVAPAVPSSPAVAPAVDSVPMSTPPPPAAPPAPTPAPTPTGPYTLQEHADTARQLRAGTLSADQLKQQFRRLADSEAAVKAELATKPLKVLAPNGTGGRKKQEIVDGIYRRMLERYVVGTQSIRWNPFGGESYKDAVAAVVNRTTDADLQKYGQDVQQAQAEHAQARAAQQQALVNPQSLEDFQTFVAQKGEDQLDPEQLARYDDLRATARRDRDRERQEQQATVAAVADKPAGLDMDIKEGFHARKGKAVYVAVLNQRVERDQYEDLNAKAKKLGGYYSSFKGQGAIPGFQFPTKEAAEQFKALLSGDVDTSANLAQRADQKRTGAAARLQGLADSAQARAQEELNRDRLTNTARRADMAAGIEARARGDMARARTLQRIAEGLENGTLKHLGGLHTASQVDALDGALRDARNQANRAAMKANPNADRQEDFWNREPTAADIDQARYPYPRLWASQLRQHAREMEQIPGLKLIAKQMLSQAKEADVKFKGQGGGYKFNGGRLLTPDQVEAAGINLLGTGAKDKQIRVHTSYDWRLAREGKGHGPFYTADGGKSFGTTPEVAVSAALARGNPLDLVNPPEDQLLTLDSPRDVAILQEAARKLRRHPDRALRHMGETLQEQAGAYNRLQAADIKNLPELRAALREYLPLKVQQDAEDPVKKMERDLIGRKIPGFFPTPRPLINRMLDEADIQPGMTVLEPSAGKGDILDALKEREPEAQASALEVVPSLRSILAAKGHAVVGEDFTQHDPAQQYDRIVMNPPFEAGQDAAHVQQAYAHLKPGGRLVAVLSSGPFQRQGSKDEAFRQWLAQVGGHDEALPERSFAGADAFRQTGVNTHLVVIDKPNEKSPTGVDISPSGDRMGVSEKPQPKEIAMNTQTPLEGEVHEEGDHAAKYSSYFGGWLAFKHGKPVRSLSGQIKVYGAKEDAMTAAKVSKMEFGIRRTRRD